MSDELTVADYEEAFRDHRRLVREIDVIMNGDKAAKQASLCDLVGQIKELVAAKEWAERRLRAERSAAAYAKMKRRWTTWEA